MKFEIKREVLSEVLNNVSKLISSKSSIPILQGILLEVDEDELRLTASNNSETIQHSIPVDGDSVEVFKTGKVVLPKQIVELVKKAKKKVEFNLEGFTTKIKSGKSVFELNCLDAEEFPKLPEVNTTEPNLRLRGTQFSDLIKKTRYAASTSETRPILQGVLFEIQKDCIHLVCTDSHRLGQIKQTCENSSELRIVIPSKALDDVLKTFDLSKDVELFAKDQMILLRNGQTIYFSRLLEGNYPDTSRLIPNDFKSEVQVDRKEFLNSLERIKTLADAADNGKGGVIKMHVNGVLTISTHQAQTGKGRDEVQYSSLEGEDDFTISFSAKYMIDALKTVDCDEVVFKYQGDMRPFLLVPSEQKSYEELQLILPVRTT
ncbi:DNA polymerase III subunit beta [Metabacillus herbersteinensis]|uniref:Beta sliding clamp n=1 Tax=Metabacillus herbersteinensis TaxID=283816 RepID=A0ABV6GJ80_9BACI